MRQSFQKISSSFLLFLLLLGLSITPVSAVDTGSGSSLNSGSANSLMMRRDNTQLKDLREEVRNKKQELQNTRGEFVRTKRAEVAHLHGTRLSEQFTRLYNRFTNLITRVQSRINTMKNDGKDVAAAQASLDQAKTSLTKAKDLGDQAVAKFAAISPEDTDQQRQESLAARDLAIQAREQFRLVLASLKNTIQALKSANK